MNELMLVQAFVKALELSGITNKLIATNGTVIIDTTTPTNVDAVEIMAQSDTVITTCNGVDVRGIPVNFVTAFNWVNAKPGIPLIAPTGYRIKAIVLASGSIAVYS